MTNFWGYKIKCSVWNFYNSYNIHCNLETKNLLQCDFSGLFSAVLHKRKLKYYFIKYHSISISISLQIMTLISWRCMRCVLLHRFWAICVGHENQRGFCSVFSKYIAIYCFVEVFTISADFLPRPVFWNLTIACDVLSTHHKSWCFSYVAENIG